MSAWMQGSQASARVKRGDGLFRRRLMSRSDVKRTQCAGRSQNRQLMRGGRA
ncbi:hypothetical protein G8A07_22000 [Roseateles sp. DAIF2]|uniref:hypothetical protein n=1 Tax=Roseateles sp. DAIF2 TaxID=2714952 RepID=UPI0018A31E9A|nr:hypothetical protein [Roseateles sp. DAIF2]QPF75329.1 hypothetical protein G8A07_22000 [Roseateles sp. DAIF2]